MTLPGFERRRRSQVALLEYGSIPLVGSSNRTNLGSPQRAIATESFLFIPPESWPARVFNLSPRPTSSARFRMVARDGVIPLIFSNKRKCSATLSSVKRTLCCGQIPIDSRALDNSDEIGCP
mmetsp:Transcript_30806/g.45591  ORF Transcript_30806/g.45591 Transcript_30806/m.45591 type:complete len:122 (-) Transcript_30806:2311-2676(-)